MSKSEKRQEATAPVYVYPSGLLDLLKSAGKVANRAFIGTLSDTVLLRFLEVAYHASLQRDEARALQFRIGLIEPKALEDSVPAQIISPYCAAAFTPDRAFSDAEIRRLAAATDPTRVVIAVRHFIDNRGQPQLRIWGLLDARSPRIGDYISDRPRLLHDVLNLSASAPGVLSVAVGDTTVARLVRGTVVEPAGSVFDTGPVRTFFEPTIAAARARFCKNLGKTAAEIEGEGVWLERVEDEYFGIFNLIAETVEEHGHGGALLVVPDDYTITDPRLGNRVNIKYVLDRFALDVEFSRYMEMTYHGCRSGFYDIDTDAEGYQGYDIKERFDRYSDMQRVAFDLKAAAQFVARLTQVDGAVVMTRDLRVLGFGAEVNVSSPRLTEVAIARSSDGRALSRASLAEFGTRHRSVFRFCENLENSVGFVFSQDGGVKVLKQVGPQLVMWSDPSLAGVAKSKAAKSEQHG